VYNPLSGAVQEIWPEKQTLFIATVTIHLLICFWTISLWTWRQFRDGRRNEELGCLEFFTPPHTFGKACEDFLSLSKQKRQLVGWVNNNSLEVQEGGGD
jgi:hypothetical protein